MTTIILTPKNVYGKTLFYCENEAVCALTGKKTLDERDVKNLRALGLAVEVVAQTFTI